MKKILIGTHNAGKFKEIAYLISNKHKKISPISLNIKSPKETGKSFISNSKLKVKYFSKYVDYPVISDDSGLCIKALKNKPGIFFLSGFDIQGLSSGDGGVGGMAENVPHGRHFSWEDEDRVLEEITQTPIQQPIILVGHSLGGDAAVNLANRLNSMEHGFRNVDLLVTLDSVGFDNDLIPPNVKRNLNFIGDEDVFFNDGPNVARDDFRTSVFNEIRSEKHTGIDDSKEVQKKIFSAISGTLSENRSFNELVNRFSKS